MLKLDDEFATSAIVALSSFNYYYDGPCRVYLAQALKSSCTVKIDHPSGNWLFYRMIFSGSSFVQYQPPSSDSSC